MKLAFFLCMSVIAISVNASPFYRTRRAVGDPQGVIDISEGIRNNFFSGAGNAISVIKKFLDRAGGAVGNIADTAGQTIVDSGSSALEATRNFGSRVGDTLGDVTSDIGSGARTAANSVVNTWNNVMDSTKDFRASVSDKVDTAVNNVGEGLSSVGNTFADKSSDTVNAVKQFGSNVAENTGDFAMDAVDTVKNTGEKVIDKNAWVNARNSVKDVMIEAKNSMESAASGTVDKTGDVMVDAKNTISDRGGAAIETIKDVGSKASDVIGGVAKSTGSAITNAATSVRNKFSQWFG